MTNTNSNDFFTDKSTLKDWKGSQLDFMQYLQVQCAERGFDFDSVFKALAKIQEEAIEIDIEAKKFSANSGSLEKLIDELGDMFFSLINVCRLLKVDHNTVIQKNANKFYQRCRIVEQELAKKNVCWKDMTYDEIVAIWQQHKHRQNTTP